MSDEVERFRVPSEHALLTLADASGGLSALFALDAHIERHMDWLLRASEEIGQSPLRSDAATKDARALANSQIDSVRALRRDLAELAVDAEQALPAGVAWKLDIVAELLHPALPDTFGPMELLAVEASFANGMTLSLRAAADSLEALRDRLARFEDDEARELARRIEAFLEAVGQ